MNPAAQGRSAEAAPPPNPLRLTARSVEAWCSRTPAPAGAVQPAAAKKALGQGEMEPTPAKFELERAICTDRVDAHQAPADPKKNPRGLDLRAAKLTLERQTLKDLVGFSLHLLAKKGEYAELHYEDTSIAGPDITIDQLANYLRVIGAGALKMPANGGLNTVAQAPQSNVVRTSATQLAVGLQTSPVTTSNCTGTHLHFRPHGGMVGKHGVSWGGWRGLVCRQGPGTAGDFADRRHPPQVTEETGVGKTHRPLPSPANRI
ncbi:MAG: hypothetical protein U0798_12135 [Gemmataceae bacterium]